MKFLSLIAALVLEQLWPLRPGNAVHELFGRYVARLERSFNGGQFHHGLVAWVIAVLPPTAATLVIYELLWRLSPMLGWIWNIAILYVTMGFRQFSHYFTEVARSLQEGHVEEARDNLARWRGQPATELNSSEIARVAIERGLLNSHRYVFGPIAAFIVLGSAGAVLYRAAAILADAWSTRAEPEFGEFGRFSGLFFFWLDWLPSRATAASFAIVGNFEDAIYCWRTQARAWQEASPGIILASGAGAIGVRLGDSLHQFGGMEFRPEMGIGEEADADYMQSTVGLIWRALVLWLFLVMLVSIAHALGG